MPSSSYLSDIIFSLFVYQLTLGYLTLADDMILVQMSSAQEGSTQEDKDAYIAGLKKIIQDMRVKKVKDFNTVASEIAAYRARFRGDSSKILPL